jgi:hypothetical protein
MFTNAAAGAAEAFYKGDPEKNAQDAAQGSIDAIAGAEPSLQTRAYTSSFQAVKAQSKANEFRTSITEQVDGWINEELDPDEIAKRYQESVSTFVKSSVESITDPDARQLFANNLIRLTGEIEQSTSKRIKEQTDARLVEGAISNLTTAIDTGQPWSFEGTVSILSRAIGFKAAKEQVLAAIVSKATSFDDPDPALIRKVLDSKQDDGKTPSVSGAERAALEDALSQADAREEARVDRRKKAVTDAAIDRIADSVAQGVPVNQDEIIKLRQDGEIDGDTMVNLISFARSAYTNLQEGEPDEEASTTDLVDLMTNEKSYDLTWLRGRRTEILKKIANNEYGRGAAGRREGLKVLSQVSQLINGEVREQEQLANQRRSEAKSFANQAKQQANAIAAQDRQIGQQIAQGYVGLYYKVAAEYNIPQADALRDALRLRQAGPKASDVFYEITKRRGWDPNKATTGREGSSGRAPVPSSANRPAPLNPNAPAKDKIRMDSSGRPIQ